MPIRAPEPAWINNKMVQQLVYGLASLCELGDNMADARAVMNSSMSHSQLIQLLVTQSRTAETNVITRNSQIVEVTHLCMAAEAGGDS